MTDVSNISAVEAARLENATTISRDSGEKSPDLPRPDPPRHSGSSNLDIHAATYVPEWLIAINAAPATSLYCRPLDTVDFVKYIGSFAGHDFLTPIVRKGFVDVTFNCTELPAGRY